MYIKCCNIFDVCLCFVDCNKAYFTLICCVALFVGMDNAWPIVTICFRKCEITYSCDFKRQTIASHALHYISKSAFKPNLLCFNTSSLFYIRCGNGGHIWYNVLVHNIRSYNELKCTRCNKTTFKLSNWLGWNNKNKIIKTWIQIKNNNKTNFRKKKNSFKTMASYNVVYMLYKPIHDINIETINRTKVTVNCSLFII